MSLFLHLGTRGLLGAREPLFERSLYWQAPADHRIQAADEGFYVCKRNYAALLKQRLSGYAQTGSSELNGAVALIKRASRRSAAMGAVVAHGRRAGEQKNDEGRARHEKVWGPPTASRHSALPLLKQTLEGVRMMQAE